MAKKNKNKNKKKEDTVSMDIMPLNTSIDAPKAMDTSEALPTESSVSDINRKVKKGVQMKRSKNLRKLKAVAKAIANDEKAEEKVSRRKTKVQRVQSAKSLYD